MAEYIEREALLRELRQSREWHAEKPRDTALLVRCENIVREQDTILLPCLCRDCIYFIPDEDLDDVCRNPKGLVCATPEAYCPYGVSKGGA